MRHILLVGVSLDIIKLNENSKIREHKVYPMSKNAGLERSLNAGFTALAGATGSLAVGASQANAQSGSPSQSYPRHANSSYDFGTVYNRAGHNCAR